MADDLGGEPAGGVLVWAWEPAGGEEGPCGGAGGPETGGTPGGEETGAVGAWDDGGVAVGPSAVGDGEGPWRVGESAGPEYGAGDDAVGGSDMGPWW